MKPSPAGPSLFTRIVPVPAVKSAAKHSHSTFDSLRIFSRLLYTVVHDALASKSASFKPISAPTIGGCDNPAIVYHNPGNYVTHKLPVFPKRITKPRLRDSEKPQTRGKNPKQRTKKERTGVIHETSSGLCDHLFHFRAFLLNCLQLRTLGVLNSEQGLCIFVVIVSLARDRERGVSGLDEDRLSCITRDRIPRLSFTTHKGDQRAFGPTKHLIIKYKSPLLQVLCVSSPPHQHGYPHMCWTCGSVRHGFTSSRRKLTQLCVSSMQY